MTLKNPITEPLDIVILAGQSNMEGFGRGAMESAWIPNEKILMLKGDVDTHAEKYLVAEPRDEYYIELADERYSTDAKERCGVFALEFARLYCEKFLAPGRRLLLVQSSVGGTGFVGAHWGKEDALYKRMLGMADMALNMNPENRIVAMLWHQGEHDAYEQRGSSYDTIFAGYKKNLSVLIDGVRSRFGELPTVAAGFTHGWYEEYPEECRAVISATETLFSELSLCALVENTKDLKSNADVIGGDDTVHFSKIACYELGKRYFASYEALIK